MLNPSTRTPSPVLNAIVFLAVPAPPIVLLKAPSSINTPVALGRERVPEVSVPIKFPESTLPLIDEPEINTPTEAFDPMTSSLIVLKLDSISIPSPEKSSMSSPLMMLPSEPVCRTNPENDKPSEVEFSPLIVTDPGVADRNTSLVISGKGIV